ncbi:MAG: class I SAM-dependent rRNA methyltransferase [Anaerolineales bacterium]|nr:MAG: class I SAM-dependent rRNA methyltransferase [Anaerolineales bacterium]
MKKVTLKTRREKAILRRHPWIFSGAVESVTGDPNPGDVVEIHAADGRWLARGAYSPHSQIRIRVWTWNQEEEVDADFIQERMFHSIAARDEIGIPKSTNAFREVHGESDGIPGLIVDRYGDYRVVQFLSVGVERWKDDIIETLSSHGGCVGIYERSDVDVRALEGLEPRSGNLVGEEPPQRIQIHEGERRYLVDVRNGQKTGFFLDQRENRGLATNWIRGGDVLDCFCYSGGFTVSALGTGAERVTAVDQSKTALALAEENVRLNGFPVGKVEFLAEDVFQSLRKFRDRGRSFDAVILDPPKFAATTAQVDRAARGYKDVNLLAFKLLRVGGYLLTFSCSGGVTPQLFQKIVADAALDAGVDAVIVGWLSQGSDHPVKVYFPEGRYLKGLVCQIREK